MPLDRNLRWLGGNLWVGINAAFSRCIVFAGVSEKFVQDRQNNLTPLLLPLGWLSRFNNREKNLAMIRLLREPFSAGLPAGGK